MKVWALLQFFQAGLIAGAVQAVSIVVSTPLVILFAQNRSDDPKAVEIDSTFSVLSLLQLIYLLTAVGVALTRHRFVNKTANRIAAASSDASSSEPDHSAGTLAACFWFASISLAVFTLEPPPAILTDMNWYFGPYAAAPIVWSALMSVGLASFGANAHAATDAYNRTTQ